MHRVGVVGAGGRMGHEVCRTVVEADDLELVAAVDPAHAGETAQGLTIAASLDALTDAGAEIVVDFTVADAARANLSAYAKAGVHAVVGTTGLSDADLDAAAQMFAASKA